MKKGFDEVGFMEFLENEFSGFENSFLRETVGNIIDYGLEHNHNSLDQFCYWLSDILPEVEFKEVVLYMDDAHLTGYGKEQKRLGEKELDAAVQEHPWLDDMIRNAFQAQQEASTPSSDKDVELANNRDER